MQKTAYWLVIVGGVNWLLAGIFTKDIFALLSMDVTNWLPRLVYIVIGLAALVMIFKPKSSAPAPVAPKM
jgi:uncharacterized protein